MVLYRRDKQKTKKSYSIILLNFAILHSTMPSHKKINPFSKQNNDTGFASNTNDAGGRFINKDGSYNLVKEGMPFLKRFSLFQDMLNLPLWKFITVIFLFYIAINIIFTFFYLLVRSKSIRWNRLMAAIGKLPGKFFISVHKLLRQLGMVI